MWDESKYGDRIKGFNDLKHYKNTLWVAGFAFFGRGDAG